MTPALRIRVDILREDREEQHFKIEGKEVRSHSFIRYVPEPWVFFSFEIEAEAREKERERIRTFRPEFKSWEVEERPMPEWPPVIRM